MTNPTSNTFAFAIALSSDAVHDTAFAGWPTQTGARNPYPALFFARRKAGATLLASRIGPAFRRPDRFWRRKT
jgi:hypothetical protein